ncbi:glutathione peroxidase [Tateyamaria omphalii]|uniref:glutathione peroxidase n=1 Tax=Tateyamaria omphalii TaxID=299262 RepID=UPI0016787F74|nr:glutathione peroxidase [Tateyamaria omphalii]GGX38788.1 glutathione peroxidase [Tateyamaria omphalii]
MRVLFFGLFLAFAGLATADVRDAQFESIDGGVLNLSDWEGQPILVVNTASQCAFTGQYEALQDLYDTYRDDGLIVLAVPSNDFRQELDSADEVRAFCEITFGLDLPMADITRIKGPSAHPFYRALKAEAGFVPAWNFNKVLISTDGAVAGTWGSRTTPIAAAIRRAIEAELFRE